MASIGPNFIPLRMKISQMLWKANISAEYAHQDNPKFKKQLDEALERGIPFMIVFGEDEVARGVVKVKNMRLQEEQEIDMKDVVSVLLKLGCQCVQAMETLSV